jgi:hypothetical protein
VETRGGGHAAFTRREPADLTQYSLLNRALRALCARRRLLSSAALRSA